MSMAEIIEELPKLTLPQRRELCRKIIELEAEHADIALCDEAARQGFAMLDQMEVQDARRRALVNPQAREELAHARSACP